MLERGGDGKFQSHAGSIEAWEHWKNGFVWIECFNPTLVRLRLEEGAEWVGESHSFQSHAGSIEAFPCRPAVDLLSRVSIPRWFD